MEPLVYGNARVEEAPVKKNWWVVLAKALIGSLVCGMCLALIVGPLIAFLVWIFS